jgi:hypothetical protein
VPPKNWNKIWLESIRDKEQLSLYRFPQIQYGFWTKIRKNFYVLKSRNIWLKILGGLEFGETWPTASFVHLIEGKNEFQANVGQEFEISLKIEFGLILQ